MIDKAAMVLFFSTEPKPYMCILFLSTVHCLNVKVLESSTFPCRIQERGEEEDNQVILHRCCIKTIRHLDKKQQLKITWTMREDSLIPILFNLDLILKQTEQNQPNLPKIKQLQKYDL